MLGICLVHKPRGMTSHDVVNRLRRALHTKRIGHAGTLDPLASGLLVVAVGPATRFLQYLSLEPKVYIADIRFGEETASYDAEGEIINRRDVPADYIDQFHALIPSFLGLQIQVPPMFSAVKLNGQPLYKLARQGIEVERRERTIHISELSFLEATYPEIKAKVVCSGGTYIRTLAHDIGNRIGCGAHLSGLVRTSVGRFKLEEACSLDELSMDKLMPLEVALDPLPFRQLNYSELERVRNGGTIPLRIETELEYAVLLDLEGKVVSVAKVQGDFLHPECVIPAEVSLSSAVRHD